MESLYTFYQHNQAWHVLFYGNLLEGMIKFVKIKRKYWLVRLILLEQVIRRQDSLSFMIVIE